MCHKGTVSVWRYLLGASLAAGMLCGPEPLRWTGAGWAILSMELGLASPATGPVESCLVFAPMAPGSMPGRAQAGIFETTDFENWTPAQAAAEPADPPAPAVDRLPEPGAKLAAPRCSEPDLRPRYPTLSLRRWRPFLVEPDCFPQPIDYRTGATRRGRFSRRDAEQLAVANDFGVWRSMDGGLSWSGLNLHLPNLPASRILATPGGMQAARILVANLGRWNWLRARKPGSRRPMDKRQPKPTPCGAPRKRWAHALPRWRYRARRSMPARRMGASGFRSMGAEAGRHLHGRAQTDLWSGFLPIRVSREWLWRRWAAPGFTCCARRTAAGSGTI